jgi:hypothetical protein
MEIGVSQRQRIAGANRHRGPAVQPLRVHQGVPSPASTAPRVWCFKRIKVPTGTERHDVICLICIMHYFFFNTYIYIYYIYIETVKETDPRQEALHNEGGRENCTKKSCL